MELALLISLLKLSWLIQIKKLNVYFLTLLNLNMFLMDALFRVKLGLVQLISTQLFVVVLT